MEENDFLFENEDFSDESLFEGIDLDFIDEDLIDLEDIVIEDENKEVNIQEDNEEYLDITERILKLQDRLSEDIIFNNIQAQLEAPIVSFTKRFNYISLFRKKIANIKKDSVLYNKEYIENISEKLKKIVITLFEDKYSITIGETSDFYFSEKFLEDLEAIYEFFFIRHFENLVNYFYFMIIKMKDKIFRRFESELSQGKNTTDIFLANLRRKFKNESDVIVLHFISEIFDFIKESNDSAFDFFKDVCALDPYETVSIYINNMLDNYGNGIAFTNDRDAYEKYFEPLKDDTFKAEVINEVKMKFLENCQLNEEYEKAIEGNEREQQK